MLASSFKEGREKRRICAAVGIDIMAKLQFPPSVALYPLPVVLVSCLDKARKKTNIITIAWCGVVCSSPPQISVSVQPSRYSHALIKETGDFSVNIPTRSLARHVDLCGLRSGRDSDKLKLCSFTELPPSKISSPIIKECPVNIECRLKDIIKLGSHDMFIGQVVAMHADDSIMDKNGRIDYNKAEPFIYNQGEYWDIGKKIGFYGFSSK